MKKILIFCLYCVVFTLLPAASILAQGGKDDSKAKPFPALEVPAEEGETFYLSGMTSDDNNADETSPVPDTTDVSEATAVNKDESPSTLEITVVNEDKSAPVPKAAVVNEDKPPPVPVAAPVIDKPPRGNADTTTTASAAESAAAAAQSAAAAAQSARVAESAAATATAAAAAVTAAPPQPPPSQPQPSAVQPQPPAVQPQPTSSRLPPQPPARTLVPTVNIIVPQAAPPAAPPAPPAYRPSMNVTPGMPDPSSNGVYRIQVGSFSNTGLAQQCFNRLKAAGFTPFYEQYGSLYRVVISGIQAADMAGVIRRLEAAGFTDAWIREER